MEIANLPKFHTTRLNGDKTAVLRRRNHTQIESCLGALQLIHKQEAHHFIFRLSLVAVQESLNLTSLMRSYTPY